MATFNPPSIVLKLKSILKMDTAERGVLDFTRKELASFCLQSTELNIFNKKYHDTDKEGKTTSESRATCLENFWNKEDDSIVGKLLCDLLESSDKTHSDFEDCLKEAERLKNSL